MPPSQQATATAVPTATLEALQERSRLAAQEARAKALALAKQRQAEQEKTEAEKRKRAARFQKEATQVEGRFAKPKRTFAHAGGMMTTNKEDALRSFVDRKEEALRAKKAKLAELQAVQRKNNAELHKPKPYEMLKNKAEEASTKVEVQRT